MLGQNGSEPVADDEILYRRIPVSRGYYSEGLLSPEAFHPRKDEQTGISVYRAKYKSVKDAARGKSSKGYYVAVLRAGDIRKHDMNVAARPLPGDPGHAELPELTGDNRRTDETYMRKRRLTTLCLRVEGPFKPEP